MNTRDLALRYLTMGLKTQKQVADYLEKKGCPDDEVCETLIYLLDMHYLDDDRYCRDYYHYGASKGKSMHLMKYELGTKGVEAFQVEDAFAALAEEENLDLPEEERERASHVAERIASREGRADVLRVSGKIGRRLKTLGYDSDLIYEIVGRYMREENEQ